MKRILILNGNPTASNTAFDIKCETLKEKLVAKGNDVQLIKLREKQIKDCIGCYSCWLKTPGICALKDDQAEILKSYLNSDLVLLASPLVMGFVSAVLKKVNDRLLPLVHPFLRIVDGRMSHFPRYDKKYNIGVLIEKDEYYEETDLEMIHKIYKNSLFVKFIDDQEAVVNEAHNL